MNEKTKGSCSPRRIQRKRTKGWRMPENTVSVCRPGKWGNPFPMEFNDAHGRKVAVWNYKLWIQGTEEGQRIAEAAKRELRGKNLACWCPVDQACHADVLLRMVNASLSIPGGDPEYAPGACSLFYVVHPDAQALGFTAPHFATRKEAEQKCDEWNKEIDGHYVMEIKDSSDTENAVNHQQEEV